jgi:putative hemolysin
MVTLEDVVEEIVGEMRDEHRRHDEQKIVQREDGSWLLDGTVSVADMIDRLAISPDVAWEGRGFSTVAGLILDCLGHIPATGDTAEWDGLHLEVVDMDGQRIDRVLVTRKAEQR